MASFKAKLFINGEERNLLFVEQEIRKYADITGRPNGKKGMPDVLRFAIESTGDDSFFYHNMFSPNNMIDGEIVFYKRDGFSVLFKIEFANSYVLGLREEFDHNNDLPLHMFLEIGWGIVRYKGVIIEKYWNPFNPWEQATPTTLQQDEPTLLEYFFEDMKGERIEQEEIEIDEKVTLVIATENASGETISINLNDDDLDYEYNGQLLKNDTLSGVSLSSDETRVSLKAVAQQN